jgi:hypothetical protein
VPQRAVLADLSAELHAQCDIHPNRRLRRAAGVSAPRLTLGRDSKMVVSPAVFGLGIYDPCYADAMAGLGTFSPSRGVADFGPLPRHCGFWHGPRRGRPRPPLTRSCRRSAGERRRSTGLAWQNCTSSRSLVAFPQVAGSSIPYVIWSFFERSEQRGPRAAERHAPMASSDHGSCRQTADLPVAFGGILQVRLGP